MHRTIKPGIGLCSTHCMVMMVLGFRRCQMSSSWSYMLIVFCSEVEGGVPIILSCMPMLQQMSALSSIAADRL